MDISEVPYLEEIHTWFKIRKAPRHFQLIEKQDGLFRVRLIDMSDDREYLFEYGPLDEDQLAIYFKGFRDGMLWPGG